MNFFQKIAAPIGAILLFTPLAPIGAVLLGINIVVQTVSFVVRTGTLMDVVWSVVNAVGSAICSTVLPGIFDAARGAFQAAGNAFSNAFTSIGQAIPLLGKVIGAPMEIFQSLAGAATDIATQIWSSTGLTETVREVVLSVGARIIEQGVSLGANSLFKGMGLDPSFANIGSALMTGAVMGGLTAGDDIGLGIVEGALKYGTIAGVDEIGEAADLDPNITSLAGMMAGSLMAGSLNMEGKTLTYNEVMENIKWNVASECAYIGVTEVGELLGVDPRISYLAGVGIRSTLKAGLDHEFEPDVIWGGIQQGLLQGVTNIGLSFATEELGISPLLANIGFSAISGAINAGIQAATGGSQNVFQSLFKTYTDNALTVLGSGDPSNAWQQAAYISQILDFSDIAQERGLAEALNSYGAGFFNAVAVNSIVQSGYTIGGYFAEKLQAGQYTTRTLNDSTEVVVVTVEDGQGNAISDTFFQEKGVGESRYWDLMGGEEYIGGDSYLGWGDFGIDAYGKLGYTDAELYSIFDSDIQYQRVIGGQQAYAEIKDSLGNTLLIIEPTAGGYYNVYDSYGEYVDAKIGSQTYCNFIIKGNALEFKNIDNGATILFEGNKIINFSIDNSSGAFDNSDIEIFKSLSNEDKTKVISAFMTFGHGFNKEAVAGGMTDIMQSFVNDLMADGVVSETSAFGITIYKGNIFENAYWWSKDAWFGDDTLTNEVVTQMETYLNSLTPEQRALGIAHFAHSGNFRPTIEGLNKNPDLNVHTIINYEGPYVGDTVILNPNVRRII
ncbi:MAG: hypothetical protein KJ584_03325, partial [Candidatus Omnitrophica bacterium]|nr:hypothetical protein [Candidatus Omnitrophota bacterium]